MDFIKWLQKFKIFQHHYQNPLEFYQSLIESSTAIASVSGLGVLSEDFKIFNFNLICLNVVFAVYTIVCASTLYEIHGDFDDLVYCLVTVGIGLQGVMKMLTFVIYRKELVWTQEYTKSLYREEGKTHWNSLMSNLSILNVLTKCIAISYATMSTLMIGTSFLLTILTSKKTLTFGFWIPFLDRNSWLGYLCNFVMQFCMTVFITSENMGNDIIFFMILLSSATQIELLTIKVQDLETRMVINDSNLHKYIKEIVKRHQEHLRFVRTVEKIYRKYFFVLFSTLGATLVLVIYTIVTRFWLAGCIPFMFIIYDFFIFCFLPTFLEIKKDNLQQEIYNTPWYRMSTGNRKLLQLLLLAVQQPNCLTMIFYPLSMPSFADVLKIVYNISALLVTTRNR